MNNHQDIETCLSAMIDSALPPEEVDALAMHLVDCEQCKQAYADMLSMQNWLRRDAMQPLPAGLEAQLLASIKEPAPISRPQSSSGLRKKIHWFWPSCTALGGALAGALLVAMFLPQAPSSQAMLTQEVLAGHVRALQVTHLADVMSTDQHTVKPWFAGKLDFSPPVHDLAHVGFALSGGRLDYLQQRPVAALVYRYKLHVINLYIWPSADTHTPLQHSGLVTTQTQQGYQVLSWQQEGMNFWAVSDLNAAELQHFAALLHATAP